MTGISILAPLSWYVLAKGHSYIHINICYVLWSIPFAILVVVLVSALFVEVSSKVLRYYQKNQYR